MNRNLLIKAVTVLLAGVVVLSGCSSSTDDEASSSDPTTSAAATDDSSGGDSGADDAGSGTVTVDGVENAGFAGECEVSRDNGREDVGDITTEGIEVILAIDNVGSDPAEEMNFVVTGTPNTFRAVGIGNGDVRAIEYVGVPDALADTREIGVVAFSGTTDDGTDVTAEVVCIIQNAFS